MDIEGKALQNREKVEGAVGNRQTLVSGQGGLLCGDREFFLDSFVFHCGILKKLSASVKFL